MRFGRYFALISGAFFILLGLAGFIPSFVTSPSTMPNSIMQYGIVTNVGELFGVFPTNAAESILYIGLGVFGVAAAIALDSARLYSGLLAVILGLLTVMGLFPFSRTVFGLFPIYGNDIWLHGVIAVIAAYFGFIARPDLKEVLESEVGSNVGESA